MLFLLFQIHNYFQTSVDKLSKRSVVEKTLSSKRRRRKDKLAILMYGLYSHLHETLSALQFSLEFLKPHPWSEFSFKREPKSWICDNCSTLQLEEK